MASERPKSRIELKEFPGISVSVDEFDLPPGVAAEQINVRSDRVGELTSRGGMLPVTFEA